MGTSSKIQPNYIRYHHAVFRAWTTYEPCSARSYCTVPHHHTSAYGLQRDRQQLVSRWHVNTLLHLSPRVVNREDLVDT